MGGGGERWWDGIAWSESFTRPAPGAYGAPAVPAAPGAYAGPAQPQYVVADASAVTTKAGKPSKPVRQWEIVASWILAVLAPIFGILAGLSLYSRNNSNGAPVVFASLIVIAIHLTLRPLGN
jgi:hypothetical protein